MPLDVFSLFFDFCLFTPTDCEPHERRVCALVFPLLFWHGGSQGHGQCSCRSVRGQVAREVTGKSGRTGGPCCLFWLPASVGPVPRPRQQLGLPSSPRKPLFQGAGVCTHSRSLPACLDGPSPHCSHSTPGPTCLSSAHLLARDVPTIQEKAFPWVLAGAPTSWGQGRRRGQRPFSELGSPLAHESEL